MLRGEYSVWNGCQTMIVKGDRSIFRDIYFRRRELFTRMREEVLVMVRKEFVGGTQEVGVARSLIKDRSLCE